MVKIVKRAVIELWYQLVSRGHVKSYSRCGSAWIEIRKRPVGAKHYQQRN